MLKSKWTAILLCVFLLVLPAAAQSETPNYEVRSLRPGQPDTPRDTALAFDIYNSGAAAAEQATVTLHLLETGEVLDTETVPPLQSNEQSAPINFSVPAANFDAGSRVPVGILIRFPGQAAANPPALRDYAEEYSLEIPDVGQTTAPAPTTPAPAVTIPGLPFNIDLTNPLVIVAIVGGLGVLLILIWVLTVILGLLFSRTPSFANWQPPYMTNPMIDPNSVQGRRQLWQQHAQSDSLAMPCAADTYMVRKLLMGIDGRKLSGWKVTGARISQYDMYGRVGRSEYIAAPGTVRALSNAARRIPADRTRAEKLTRPVARKLVDELLKRANKRNLMLPVAVDLRLKGSHGEVLIVFELHRCTGSGWQQVDQWEPDMLVVGGTVQENFTYTLYGQYGGETLKQFRQRLRADLTLLLATMVQQPPVTASIVQPLEPLPNPDSIMDTAPVPVQSSQATAANRVPPMPPPTPGDATTPNNAVVLPPPPRSDEPPKS
jgi:hypothetical protein